MATKLLMDCSTHPATVTTPALTAGEVTQQTTDAAAFGPIAAAAATAVVNTVTLTAKAPTILTTNIAYQAVAVPSVAQTTAQIAALTAQVNALTRLVMQQLQSTAGT